MQAVGAHGNESGNEEKPCRCESNRGSCAFPLSTVNSCVKAEKNQRESELVALVLGRWSLLSECLRGN